MSAKGDYLHVKDFELLTQKDQALLEQGLVSVDRLKAFQFALRSDATSARALSYDPELDERKAASLRGKAGAYQHAAQRIDTILAGNSLRKPKWSEAYKRAREYWIRRRANRT